MPSVSTACPACSKQPAPAADLCVQGPAAPAAVQQQEEKQPYVLSTQELRRKNREVGAPRAAIFLALQEQGAAPLPGAGAGLPPVLANRPMQLPFCSVPECIWLCAPAPLPQAFEMFLGSAVKGLEATGEVPELADEQEVLAAAQQAARAAATQAGGSHKGKGKAAVGGKGKGKSKAATPAAEDEEDHGEGAAGARWAAGVAAAAAACWRLPCVWQSASKHTTPSAAAPSLSLCSGPSRKRSGSPLGWNAELGAYGSSGRGEGGGPSAPKRPTLVFEKCGTCKCCLNPKLKKACVVVRMQRKEAGYPRS